MEFNPNFTYMLYSATAEDSACHKKKTLMFITQEKDIQNQLI
jgi:hypothetical protein